MPDLSTEDYRNDIPQSDINIQPQPLNTANQNWKLVLALGTSGFSGANLNRTTVHLPERCAAKEPDWGFVEAYFNHPE